MEVLRDPHPLAAADWVFSGPLTPRGQECPVGFGLGTEREKAASCRCLMLGLATVVSAM